MQEALHLKTTVLPGGRIEIADRNLPVGEPVDVVITRSPASPRKSAVDILREAPGPPPVQEIVRCGVLPEGRTRGMEPLTLPAGGAGIPQHDRREAPPATC